MTTVLLIIHLFVTLALIGVVLIQRSEGGGLGIGSSQGMGSFMSGRGTANLLTRTTAMLATVFMALSLTLALMNRGTTRGGRALDPGPGQRPRGADFGANAGQGPSGARARCLGARHRACPPPGGSCRPSIPTSRAVAQSGRCLMHAWAATRRGRDRAGAGQTNSPPTRATEGFSGPYPDRSARTPPLA